MLSKSVFGILKQKALVGLQQNLETVGIHSNTLDNTVLKSEDPYVARLNNELLLVEESLRALKKSAFVFYNSVKPMGEANASVSDAVGRLDLDATEPLVVNCEGFVAALDSTTLGRELKQFVVDPIDNKLTWLVDLKGRVKARSLLRLELRHCDEVVESLSAKAPGSTKLSQAEDKQAEKRVLYDQINASLLDDLDSLRVERYEIVNSAYKELKMCQCRFLMGAAQRIQQLCEEDVVLPATDIQVTKQEEFVEVTAADAAADSDGVESAHEDADHVEGGKSELEETSVHGASISTETEQAHRPEVVDVVLGEDDEAAEAALLADERKSPVGVKSASNHHDEQLLPETETNNLVNVEEGVLEKEREDVDDGDVVEELNDNDIDVDDVSADDIGISHDAEGRDQEQEQEQALEKAVGEAVDSAFDTVASGQSAEDESA